MTWLRHAGRHVHASVMNEVRDQLTTLGWLAADSLPFGTANADVVTLVDTPAFAGDALAQAITSGVVSCTLGDEMPPMEEELGGPLSVQEYPLFFDVFQKTDAAAKALASDIRDILLGRLPGTRRWLPLINQVTNTEVVGWRIELDDVERVGPHATIPLHWQVVHVTASAYFPEVQY